MFPMLQSSLWSNAVAGEPLSEDPAYLKEQILTYLGNKRSLLPVLARGVEKVRSRLGRHRLRALDAFAGSGVVSRFLKQYCDRLVSNDFEAYSAVINRCYLANRPDVDMQQLNEARRQVVAQAEADPKIDGFIRRLYAPADETKIKPGERVFYTVENAIRLDSLREAIENAPTMFHDMLLGPLLVKASIHTNTSGVFKGFYKDSQTRLGCYGGQGGNALQRIRRKIELPLPILSRFDCDISVRCKDANELVLEKEDFDLAYFDPPYNQHPYGSNYFMLNLLVLNREPQEVSRVSGIPTDWQRSLYNKRSHAALCLRNLIQECNARFILLSYSDDGFIKRAEFDAILKKFGKVDVIEEKYNTFRGCRNLRSRSAHVTEQLFIVEKF